MNLVEISDYLGFLNGRLLLFLKASTPPITHCPTNSRKYISQ